MTAAVMAFMQKRNMTIPAYAKYMGKDIKIDRVSGAPNYTGKRGRVLRVDDKGQLHGTWGSLALIPEDDRFHIIAG